MKKILGVVVGAVLVSQLSFATAQKISNKDVSQNADVAVKVLNASDYYSKLSPKDGFDDIVSEVIVRLSYSHYRSFFYSMALDDDLSEALFHKFIKELDPAKVFFLQSDIDRISVHKHKMDDYLKDGYFQPFYEIYNLYQKRMVERYIDLIQQDLSQVNFEIDETMIVDRDKADWAVTNADLNEIWRKRLKNTLLSMKLTDSEKKDYA